MTKQMMKPLTYGIREAIKPGMERNGMEPIGARASFNLLFA